MAQFYGTKSMPRMRLGMTRCHFMVGQRVLEVMQKVELLHYKGR